MQSKPKTLREALEQVRGGAAAEKPVPQNLSEALKVVRSAQTATAPANNPAKAADTTRKWWERK